MAHIFHFLGIFFLALALAKFAWVLIQHFINKGRP